MRTLPRNICAHPDGYLVRIERGDLKWQAFVPYSRPDALAEATRLRDKFYQVAPKVRSRSASKIARSNTDVVGISETIHWKGTRPHRCFIVHAPDATGVCRNRRFYYGAHRPRTEAFELAVAHRAQSLGKKPADLLPSFL